MTFTEFCKREHEKRVAHFVRFVDATGNAPSVANAEHIFGFCARDAKPIVADTIKIIAERKS
jgi:hypothetical protein